MSKHWKGKTCGDCDWMWGDGYGCAMHYINGGEEPQLKQVGSPACPAILCDETRRTAHVGCDDGGGE